MNPLTETELDPQEFMKNVFTQSPMPPFSYKFDMSNATERECTLFLQNFLVSGADLLYSKNLNDLSERQIGTLRDYLLSVGYDADYELVNDHKIVKNYHPDGSPFLHKVRSTRTNITFKLADPRLNRYSSCSLIQPH